VNTVESDRGLPVFYAGSRDGQVKVAAICDEKIKFIGGIIAHTQSVNSICAVGNSNNGVFVTGSSDRCAKFWKPDLATLERLGDVGGNVEG
jgi:WD40 repeat protein